MDYNEIRIGDTVYLECLTSIAQDMERVCTDIKVKYDEDTGMPYNVICFEDHEFDSRTGLARNSPTMFAIRE